MDLMNSYMICYDFSTGYMCTRKYTEFVSTKSNLYSVVSNTYDGFLYGTCNTTHPEFADAMSYNVSIPVKK